MLVVVYILIRIHTVDGEVHWQEDNQDLLRLHLGDRHPGGVRSADGGHHGGDGKQRRQIRDLNVLNSNQMYFLEGSVLLFKLDVISCTYSPLPCT